MKITRQPRESERSYLVRLGKANPFVRERWMVARGLNPPPSIQQKKEERLKQLAQIFPLSLEKRRKQKKRRDHLKLKYAAALKKVRGGNGVEVITERKRIVAL